jgi:hypothetical protein
MTVPVGKSSKRRPARASRGGTLSQPPVQFSGTSSDVSALFFLSFRKAYATD